jgi:hypothetical protein
MYCHFKDVNAICIISVFLLQHKISIATHRCIKKKTNKQTTTTTRRKLQEHNKTTIFMGVKQRNKTAAITRCDILFFTKSNCCHSPPTPNTHANSTILEQCSSLK